MPLELPAGAPAVGSTTGRLWLRLPHYIRSADADGAFPLLRYRSLLWDQAGELEDLLDRIDFRRPDEGGPANPDGTPADRSDLVDPAAADDAWLAWLAQLAGVNAGDTAGTALRELIASARSRQVCTRGHIAAAARTVLTGERYVLVVPSYGGDPWTIEVRVRTSELPGGGTAEVVDTIERARARPAGHDIAVTARQATWDAIEAARPTWDDYDGSTWTEIEETGF